MNNIKDSFYNIKQLTKRNMIIFFKNKTTLFFSLIAPVLILIIYSIFLSDMQLNIVKDSYPNINLSNNEIKSITNAWLISGIIGVSLLTVSLNTMFISIVDRERNIINDFKASPVNSINLTLSYFISSFIITFILSFMFVIIGNVYLLFSNGTIFLFGFLDIIKILSLLILSALSSVIILLFITSFFNKSSTAASFTGIFTALIGFLIGVYLPTSFLPKTIASFANLIPGSQVTALFRNIFMNKVLLNSNISSNIDSSIVSSLKDQFGFNLYIFNYHIRPVIMIIYLILTTLLFFILNVYVGKLRRKKKY